MEFCSLSCIIPSVIICPISYGCVYYYTFGFKCVKPNFCCFQNCKYKSNSNIQVYPVTEAFDIITMIDKENIVILKSETNTNEQIENSISDSSIIPISIPISIPIAIPIAIPISIPINI